MNQSPFAGGGPGHFQSSTSYTQPFPISKVLRCRCIGSCTPRFLCQLPNADSIMSMGWNLSLREIEKGNNFVVSPISLCAALSLLASGARGPTLQQLLLFLGVRDLDDLLSRSKTTMELSASGKAAPLAALANGIWLHHEFALKSSFTEKAESIFQAYAKAADFDTAAEQVRGEVNSWVEDVTGGIIKDLLPPSSLHPKLVSVLVNAVSFKGVWREAFDVSRTQTRDFYLLSGATVRVPFMTPYRTRGCSYQCFDEFKLLQIPYRAGQKHTECSFSIFLPHKARGLQDLIGTFDSLPKFLDNCLGHGNYGGQAAADEIWIPKLKFSYDFEASGIMKELGLTLPFDSPGEFTEMIDSPNSNLFHVNQILHKCCIEVNEEGTKVASAAAVSNHTGCPSQQPKTFVADHAFMFVIRDELSKVVFFTGVMLNPGSTN